MNNQTQELNNEKGYSSKRFLTIITVVATFGGVLFGYDTGVINGALPFMAQKDQLNLTPLMEGWVASSLLFGAAIGSILVGRLSDKLGRRKTIIYLATLFFLASIGCAAAPTVSVMIFFRFMLGLAVGGASVTVPVYLAELAPPEKRGRMIIQNDVMIISGQLLAFTFNAILGVSLGDSGHVWRYMLTLSAIPAIVLGIGMRTMPESPRWLVAKGKISEAINVLLKVREENAAKSELQEIEDNVAAEASMKKATYKDLNIPWVRRIVFLGIGLACVQQVSGVGAIMYYGTQILTNSGFSMKSALVGNIGNGVISVLACITGMWLIGVVGRRPLLIGGQIGIITTLILIGIFSRFMNESPMLPYVVLSLTVSFLVFQQAAISNVTWLMLSEIFPLRLRGLGIGLAVFCLWIVNSLIGLFFPLLLTNVGLSTTFFSFAVVNIISVTWVYLYMPETKGMSLEAIENRFRNNKHIKNGEPVDI